METLGRWIRRTVEVIVEYVPRGYKAVTAGVTAASAEYALAQGMGDVTAAHWAFILVTAGGVALSVWAVPNRQPEPEMPNPYGSSEPF